jgi:hypothetical protein
MCDAEGWLAPASAGTGPPRLSKWPVLPPAAAPLPWPVVVAAVPTAAALVAHSEEQPLLLPWRWGTGGGLARGLAVPTVGCSVE